MGEKIVIAVVIAVTLGAHWWLYKWVKFKMDEGAIIEFLNKSKGREFHSTNEIAASVSIPEPRISVVCNRSKAVGESTSEAELWHLT